MILAEIIWYVSIGAWFFPLIRQYKHKYFHFFLILAFSDPFNFLMFHVFHFSVERSLLISTLLMIFSFSNFYRNHFYIYSLIILVTGTLILTLLPISDYSLEFLILMFLLVIVFIALKLLVLDTMHTKTIGLFHLVLFLYVLSLALKFFIDLTLIVDFYIYFQITTTFEILVAVFFCFYNESNTKRIKLAT